ncbi:UDP-N-acetylmuramate--L-alanine ligase [Flexilinea flocculi]|jgi:UDP-N-acetylmuramate--alanine ligase|uniref:Multifunctional fusion protein n=1 Tax=Flexilinea flocculi TaxID=1678840 RepID=A0A0S7BX01_9CHLR|nr:UDP-N-acetylmuramate--L-alanine ligase [Flexilinea flocculi]GAP41748.1 UDP-N-acetylmuramate dehydrogenase [Flexilinea flocculi]
MKNLKGKHIHIIGIGGTGMSAIALVLHELGVNVTGSDRSNSISVSQLEKNGIYVKIGHSAENVKDADIVVYSSAIAEENPELIEARRMGIPAQKRMEFLDSILSEREVIAISGTHGKTTTTSMTAWILKSLQMQPGFIIGSTPKNIGKNAEAGKGNLFVIEADEYDRMFLGLHPAIAVVTKIEHDHPDCYPTESQYLSVFSEFLANTRENGIILLNSDDPKQASLSEKVNSLVKIYTFGIEKASDFQAEKCEITENGCYRFVFSDNLQKKQTIIQLSIAGKHNVYNALAALSICSLKGLNLDDAADALKNFQGIERRFETIAEWNGIKVIDDYAHHPTEIKATLTAARDAFPHRRIWALWQPHTYSRTKSLLNEFCDSFNLADVLFVTNIYASREKQTDFGFEDLKTALKQKYPKAFFADTNEMAVELLRQQLRPDDVVVTLSAGDANQFGPAAIHRMIDDMKTDFNVKYSNTIQHNMPLSQFSRALCGGPAKEIITANSIEELIEIIKFYQINHDPYKVFGGLTNVLFSDNGFDGTVILNHSAKIAIYPQGDSAVVIADSGLPLISVVKTCAETGLEGFEWAYGIPGTLGGAVYGNAGAFGHETKELVKTITLLKEDTEVIEIPNEKMGFGYRSSILKDKLMRGTVLRVAMELNYGDPLVIKEKMDQIIAKRRVVHPEGKGSLGSVFKNPAGFYAGKLIEECGLKGKTIGRVHISEAHGNTIITEPGAKSADYVALMQLMQKEVKERFGIDLIPEIEVLP